MKRMLSALALGLGTLLGAQSLTTQINPEMDYPLGDSAYTDSAPHSEKNRIWSLGGGAESQWHLTLPPGIPVLSNLEPFVTAGYRVFPNDAGNLLGISTGGLGLEGQYFLTDRWGAGVSGAGGLYQGTYNGATSTNYFWQAGANVKFRVTPAFQIGLSGAWQQFLYQGAPMLETASVQLGFQLAWDGFQDAGHLDLQKVNLDPIYPVLYSQYDKQKIGTVTLVNREIGEIHNVKVSFFLKQYMERPKVSTVAASVPRGGSLEAPLYALLTSETLKLIESTKVLAEITVEYEFLGVVRHQSYESPMRIYNRNAMSWDDDRKASAFVSSKDPAVLRYSKFVAGVIRSKAVQAVSQNLQFGIGLFECLKLLGLNYVIDPTTPYTEFSSNASAVDFLQFPFQTLTYRGGDCDDLSILFASVLQSVGIRTAFITVPGHIYMAFALDITAKEAQTVFANLDNLIAKDGTLWVPVEITMLGADFTKAWTYGMQEWQQAGDKAKLYPMDDSWKLYDPVSPPDQDTRITLPDPREVENQILTGLGRFADANLPPRLDELKQDLAAAVGADKGKVLNKMGILYTKYGKLNDARDSFLAAGKAGFTLSETNLGNLALLQKDYPTAQQRFERSQRANPTDFPTVLGLALTYYETERYEQAAAQYKLLVNLDPVRAAQYQFLSKGLGVNP